MATRDKKMAVEAVLLSPDDPTVPRPRLHKLIITNFRSIGSAPVTIELDEIVVLVGPNNAGKSTILRAYEVAMRQGSKDGQLSIGDFPNGQVDDAAKPEIEIQTIVFNNAPGDRWISRLSNGEMLVRERFTWSSPNRDPKRQGFDVEANEWSEQVPWGMPAVANSRRPVPHRIEAFATPEKQAKDLADLLISILKDKLLLLKSDANQARSDYEQLIEHISEFQARVVASAQVEIEEMEQQISDLLSRVFPRHVIKMDLNPAIDSEKSYTPFKSSPEVLMGSTDGYMSRLAEQGSGARRTLLWSALRYLSETAAKESSRPHLLLLDEPEICLHPAAIREARSVLYDLPKSNSWQVMITTHSPVFIDLSRDNTTIIRVDRGANDIVQSTTLYRPDRAALDADDKQNLKALNVCDPYVHEFFFGGNIVIVEGDTEYTAFSLVRDLNPDKYRGLHIIRARGKGIIVTLMKVLNQFSANYAVLHDSDTPLSGERKNPAWTMNGSIAVALAGLPEGRRIRHLACITNFEDAMFGHGPKSDKPYHALRQISSDNELRKKVEELLDSLISDSEPPANCVRWRDLGELEAIVAEREKGRAVAID